MRCKKKAQIQTLRSRRLAKYLEIHGSGEEEPDVM